MIIIWGWRAVKTVIGTGEFYCPRCGVDTPYQHLKLRRWFTLFFLPLIPLQVLGTCIECTRCKGQYTEAVLAAPTLGIFEHHQGLANRAAVAHLASLARPLDSAVEDAAIRVAATAAGVRPDYDRNALHADIRAFGSPAVVATYLRAIAEPMTMAGREDFLRRMARLVENLPHRVPDMDRAVEGFADALDISRAHLLGIRGTTSSDAPTPGSEL